MIIYLITNHENGKKYVGQHCYTKDARWKQHLNAALKLNDPKPLYAAIRKYGLENFSYRVLEELGPNATQELLDDREKHFIKEYDTYIANGKGYNLTLGGQGFMVTYCSSGKGKKVSDKLDRTDYACYDPESGDLVDTFDKLEPTWDKPGIYRSSKYENSDDDGVFKVVDGYIWLQGPEGHTFPKKIEIVKTYGQRKMKPRVYDTEIAQYSLAGLLVHVWDEPPGPVSLKLGIPYQSLVAALKGNRRAVGGYLWRRFPKGKTPDEIDQKLETHQITFSKRQLTEYPIYKYIEGKEVMRYPSVMDAILDSNLAPTEVLNSLEFGKPDSKGSFWKWITRPQKIKHDLIESRTW